VRRELASTSEELRTYANEWGEGIVVTMTDGVDKAPIWIYLRGTAYSIDDGAAYLTPRLSPLKDASPEAQIAARLNDISHDDIRRSIGSQ
jgi:hypothetical protein